MTFLVNRGGQRRHNAYTLIEPALLRKIATTLEACLPPKLLPGVPA